MTNYTPQQHIDSIKSTGLNCHGVKPIHVYIDPVDAITAKHQQSNNEVATDSEGYECCPWCGSHQIIDTNTDTGRCRMVEYECEDCDWTFEGIA